jgi:hypothetical protein
MGDDLLNMLGRICFNGVDKFSDDELEIIVNMWWVEKRRRLHGKGSKLMEVELLEKDEKDLVLKERLLVGNLLDEDDSDIDSDYVSVDDISVGIDLENMDILDGMDVEILNALSDMTQSVLGDIDFGSEILEENVEDNSESDCEIVDVPIDLIEEVEEKMAEEDVDKEDDVIMIGHSVYNV